MNVTTSHVQMNVTASTLGQPSCQPQRFSSEKPKKSKKLKKKNADMLVFTMFFALVFLIFWHTHFWFCFSSILALSSHCLGARDEMYPSPPPVPPLKLALVGSGLLWLALAGFGWLWLVLAGTGWDRVLE